MFCHMKESARLLVPLLAFVAISSLSIAVAAVTFSLTASSNVTVTAPKVSAIFISGSLSSEQSISSGVVLPGGFVGENCIIGSVGETITCPSFSMQAGDYVVFTAVVRNTGTSTASLTISATPVDTSVLTITADSTTPSWISAGGNATYTFTIRAVGVGNSGFTVTMSGTSA